MSFFKYGAFFLANFISAVNRMGIAYEPPEWNIVLPIGISFYTFHSLSYTIDVYRRRLEPTYSPTLRSLSLCSRSCRRANHSRRALSTIVESRKARHGLMRLPVSGVIWERLAKTYPKAVYWDQFGRRSRLPTIHFRDYTDLHFECPDYSHLDRQQTVLFTDSLTKILLKKRLIEGGKD